MTFDHPVTVVPQLQFLTQKAPSTTTTTPPSITSTAGTKLRGPTTTSTTHSTTTAISTTPADPLSHAIRVLLYSGEFDLNTNTLGTLHTLEANRWRGK